MHSLSNSVESPGVRSSSRLEAYSDALFSIVATVMIVPIAHTTLPSDQSLAYSFLTLLLPKVAVYVYTFLVVSYTWSAHVWLFQILDKVDEFIVLLNLALMMVVSFQPFTFTLLGQFPHNWLAIALFGGTTIILGLLQVLFIFHAFRNPRMLKSDLRLGNDKTRHRNRMYIRVVTPIIIALLALFIDIFSPLIALICLCLIVVGNWLRCRVVDIYVWCCHSRNPSAGLEQQLEDLRSSLPLHQRMLMETLDKERIEFLSDGVFAIVATLIILDICENDIPTEDEVKEFGSLASALGQESMLYLAYAGSFVTVALQWYIHHSLLHYIKEMNKLMVIFNQFCLLSVGLTPLAFNLTSTFNRHDFGNNESEALQFNCVVIFFASMFQMAIWITALFSQERHLSPVSHHGGKDHIYMTVKLSVYPLLSLLVYFLTIWASNFKVTAFVCMQIGAIAIFAIMGLMFSKMWRCWQSLQSPLNYLETYRGNNIESAPVLVESTQEDSDRYSASSESSTQALPSIS